IATFVLTMLDVFWFSFRAEQRINKYVKFEDTPIVDSFFEDKAIICITAHMGSWELIGQTAALRGADLASIAATIKNQTVNRILIKKREKTGQTIIPRQGALKTLISRLRKKGKTAFVLDQNTHPKNGGIWVDFLGMPMSVSPAPAALAYRTGTPIYFGFSLPEPGGHYRMIVPKIIEPPVFDKQADMDAVVHQLTQDIEDVISEKIRDYPQFWLWSYRHWQRHAGHDFPPNYPSY
uniref:lysophospholipid acyltransferase family protein n=1 Tax=Pontiella sp. TaxID=2837462 RepID=UPI003561EA26